MESAQYKNYIIIIIIIIITLCRTIYPAAGLKV